MVITDKLIKTEEDLPPQSFFHIRLLPCELLVWTIFQSKQKDSLTLMNGMKEKLRLGPEPVDPLATKEKGIIPKGKAEEKKITESRAMNWPNVSENPDEKGKKKKGKHKKGFRRLHVLLVVLAAAVIILIVTLSVVILLRKSPGSPDALGSDQTKSVCETAACIHLAHRLHDAGDPTVDPCVDFYKFSCGKYSKPSPVMDSKKLMEAILSRTEPSKWPSEEMMRMMYHKCKSTDLKEELSPKNIMKRMESIGSFPLSDPKWSHVHFTLNEVLVSLANVTKLEMAVFDFVPTIGRHLIVKTPQIKSPEHRETVINIMLNMAEEIKADQTKTAVALQELDAMLTSMDQRSLPGNGFGELVDFEELRQTKLIGVDFDRVLEAAVGTDRVKWSDVSKRVLVSKEELFFGHSNLKHIKYIDSPQHMANLIMYKFVSFLVDKLGYISTCEEWVTSSMPQAALGAVVRETVKNGKAVEEISNEIKKSFSEMFKGSKWLSDSAKTEAIKKMEGMKRMVENPERWMQDVEKRYKTIGILPDDSVTEMALKAYKFNVDDTIENIVNGALFVPGDPHIIKNAYYTQIDDFLNVFNPVFDASTFDPSFPMFAKLGGAGSVLGHEIGHGFDPTGIYYDENGVQRIFWTKIDDIDAYSNKKKCFVEQYDNYIDPDYGKNLNGSKVLGEVITDHLGSRVNWITHKRIGTSSPSDIVGFEGHDTDKLFFQVMALGWCRDKIPLDQQLKSVHPTPSFRVNGVVSNMKAFAETFKCPVGSPMNPEKKCELF